MGEPGSKSTDEVLAELAVEREYVAPEKLTEARANQLALRAMEIDQDLGLVLFEMHLLTEDQLHELRKAVAVKTGEARLVAGYEVLSEAGRGGFGVVYKARKLDTGDIVALKILPPSLASDDLVARFKRESRLVQKLGHENIVRCVEFGYDPKRKCHFCALEFIDGENLEERVEREGVLSEDDAVSITYQIAKALQHAHFNDLVHRDVKPANIMITPEGTAKLLDLGLARPASQEATRLTKTGTFMGTAHYVSPEQAKSVKGIDIRSDIYSLGATLYYMITGRPPFEGETMLDVIQQHVYEQLEWPADINPAISEGLCLVVSKMMAKDPADRYQVPKDLLRDLYGLKEGRTPEIGEKQMPRSTIARMGAVGKRRPRPASRGGRRPAREDRPVREPRGPVRERGRPVRAGEMPLWTWMALGAAGLVIGLGLVLAFALGGKEKEARKLPTVGRRSERGHDAGAEPRVPSRSERGHAAAARMKDEGGRMKTSSAVSLPPSSLLTAAQALLEAERFEVAHPEDTAGAIKRYQQVAADFPSVVEAGKARVNVIRLRSVVEAAKRAAAGVPAGLREFSGHWYRLYRQEMSWHEAKRFCEEKGGHLVTITSKEENEFVVAIARSAKESVWIGFTDERHEGKWEWVTAEKPTFTAWARDEPDNAREGEHYAKISVSAGYAWRDADRAREQYFIFEWEPANRPPNVPEDAVPFDGHRYKLYAQKMTWHNAKRFCEEKGGHLVTITSKEESDFLVGLARKAGEDTWTGLTDDRQEGRWEWVTGERVDLTAVGPGGQSSSPGEDYARLVRGRFQVWTDSHGHHRHAFICEWEPGTLPRPDKTLTLDLGGADFGKWKSGTAEGKTEVTTRAGRGGGLEPRRGLRFTVLVDHEVDGGEGGKYPVGWPRVARSFDEGELDLTRYDYLSFWIRPDSDRGEADDDSTPVRLFISSHRKRKLYEKTVDLGGKRRVWVPVRLSVKEMIKSSRAGIGPWTTIRRVQLHISERDYAHGTKLIFDIGEVSLLKLKSPVIGDVDGARKTLTLDLGGGVTMEFVYIEAGVFMMGGNEDPKYRWQGLEKPKHEVAITKGFYTGRYEVTRGQFAAFVKATGYRTEAEREGKSWGQHPGGKWGEMKGASWRSPMYLRQTDDDPVVHVSWNDAKAFCDWLAANTRREVRLPTEAEWEYACRAGSTTRFCFGDNEGALGEYAWYGTGLSVQTYPVGRKRANAWGLHDMHGNVWEWVADRCDAGYYAKSPRDDPAGPVSGGRRVLRGGSWLCGPFNCRSAFRGHGGPSYRYNYYGFRAAVPASPQGK